METFYHGTSKLFPKFDLDHALEGDGKIKMGAGFYLTTGYKRAAHYSCKSPGSTEFYVYTVEIPDLMPENHIEFKEPVNPTIVRRAEEKLGEPVPQKETTDGKFFRKYIAMKLAGKKGTQKLTSEDEMAAAEFMVSIGVIYNKVPFIWTKPVVHYDVIVMKPDVMRILKIEQVELASPRKNAKPELVEGSQREIPLDSIK
jgi:hypothetical protein